MLSRRLKRVLLYLTVIVVCAILVFPLYWMFNTSLAPRNMLYVYPPRFIHPNATLDAYRAALFGSKPMFLWLRNSGLVALACMFIAI